MADIDHFKAVNDTYGHDKGDLILASFAKTLRDNVRKSDLVGRFGGEEFIIMACPVDKDGLLKLGEKLRSAVEKSSPDDVDTTASFGLALGNIENAGNTDEIIDSLMKIADENLYKAKESGRNCVKG